MSLTTAVPLILTDPGFLFWAPAQSTEPAYVAATSTYDLDVWPVAWIPLGATEDGTEFNYETKVEAITVAEFFDPIKYSTTERSGTIGFNLASFHLNAIKRVLNGGTIATVSGSGVTLSSSYVPVVPGEVRCMIGWESLDHTVRLICSQVINGSTLKLNMKKAPSFTVLPVVFNFEIPTTGSLTGIPFKVYAAGTARLGV
jgi:hypothetical protein